MKIILKKDVAKLGKRYAVVKVADGYALNKLIPQGLATLATPENLKGIKNLTAETVANFEMTEQLYEEAKKNLGSRIITVMAEANEQGHLFEAVKPSAVHTALLANGITAIPLEAIKINSPIKTCGEHKVFIDFHNHTDSFIIRVAPNSHKL